MSHFHLPASSINIVREFVLFEISKAGHTEEVDVNGRSEAFKNLMKYKGRITRDIDCKKELMEALDEK